MAINAGDLDIERPGSNADAVTAYTYNGDGTVATVVKTYNNGTSTSTWTKTYSYTAGVLTGISNWVRS